MDIPPATKIHCQTLVDNLSKLAPKTPLTLQARKPVPLRLLEPKFRESFDAFSKRNFGSKVANEREKINYKIKREKKGAVREIRKDSQFLAKEQLKETLDRDATRKRKVKELERMLADQQGEFKQYERKKKKR